MTPEQEREARGLIWEIAIARKLYDTAVRERRFADANYYLHQSQSAEYRAQILLAKTGDWV